MTGILEAMFMLYIMSLMTYILYIFVYAKNHHRYYT